MLLVACPRMPATTYATNTRTNGWRALDTPAAQTLAGADARIHCNVLPRIRGDIDAPTGWSSGKVRVPIRGCILLRSCPGGDALLHNKADQFPASGSAGAARNFGAPPTKCGCPPSVRLGQQSYVAGFQRIV